MAASPSIFVTGASAGIGAALCRQLVADHNCRVFLGVRSLAKGAATLASFSLSPEAAARATLVQCDTTSDASVTAAAAAVRAALAGSTLYAIVNNAGVGLNTLAPGEGVEQLLDTNVHGPMRVASAFLPLLQAQGGRVVNVGSGSGPTYVKALIDGGGEAAARELMQPASAAAVLAHAQAHMGRAASEKAYRGYGLSKACLTAWTQVLAREHPEVVALVCSPGFIATNMTQGFGGEFAAVRPLPSSFAGCAAPLASPNAPLPPLSTSHYARRSCQDARGGHGGHQALPLHRWPRVQRVVLWERCSAQPPALYAQPRGARL